jgi:hypothetical protein
MSASIRQFGFTDMSGIGPVTGFFIVVTMGSPTLSGSTLHVVCRCALDGQTITDSQGTMTDNIGGLTYNLKAQLSDVNLSVNAVETLFVVENAPAGVTSLTMTTNVLHDYLSCLVVEITGVTATSFLGANALETTTTGVQSVSTGSITASNNAFIVATCVNERETGATPYAPLADTGSGFASAGTFNNYSLGLGDFGRIESKAVSANVAATFTSNGTDVFMALGAAYQVAAVAQAALAAPRSIFILP